MKARLHLNIGLLYDKVNPDMSVKYLKKALDEAQQNRDGAIQHLALLQLCESHLLSGELSQALLFGQQVSILYSVSGQGRKSFSYFIGPFGGLLFPFEMTE